jgi:hypothetical protein
MTFFRSETAALAWLLLLAGGATALGCGSELDDCAKTQTCKSRAEGGGAGETGGSTSSGASGQSGSGGASGSSGARGGSGGATGGNGNQGGTSTGGSDDMGGEGGEPTGGTGADSGTGGTGADSGAGGMPDTPDTRAPTIVSVSPADAATGVRQNANIVVTFSEPMDRVTTQAAYQSLSILPSTVTFSWNDESTVLTINPSMDLQYVESTDLAAAARVYSVAITTTAEDEAGNRLQNDAEWSFQTLRRITQTFAMNLTEPLVINDAAGVRRVCSTSTRAYCGDEANNSANFILLTTNLKDLPDGIVEWESATLDADLSAMAGDPFSLGKLNVYDIAILPSDAATWSTPAVLASGEFNTIGFDVGPRSAIIFDEIRADYSAGAQYTQFRISFETMKDGDSVADLAYFDCDSFVYTTRYLVP